MDTRLFFDHDDDERYAEVFLATDGLLKYCPRSEIGRIAVSGAPESAVEHLISTVRLRSGKLQDDVAIVLCESGVAG